MTGKDREQKAFCQKAWASQAACDKAPVCQINALYHENLTIEKFREIVKGLP